jgi:zinc/manganese transport system substrate-binding protein
MVIVVARLTGHREGDNPHLWYAPGTMPTVAQEIVEALIRADPENAASYRDRHRIFRESLRPLMRAVADLRDRHAGAPIAVTEPVFNYMAEAAGLDVRTPGAFQKAVEEGVDPPAGAMAQMEDQLKQRQVGALLYNTQTVSPVTARLRQLADRLGIPVIGVSETEPFGKSYQQWMVGQVEQLDAALGQRK